MSGALDWLAVGDVGEARDAHSHPSIGGGAGRLVAHAAALGASVGLVGKVGQDDTGGRVRDLLSRAGVNVSWLRNSPTPTSIWLEPDGLPTSRGIERGADLGLRLDELPPASIQAALTVVSGYSLSAEPARSAALGALLSGTARGGHSALLLEASLLWSTNARVARRVLEPALASAHSLALMEDDARVLLGAVTGRQAVQLLAQMGPRIIYLTEANGTVVLREGSRVQVCSRPASNRRLDRFAGPAAFWVALARKLPAAKAAEESVRYAAGLTARAARRAPL